MPISVSYEERNGSCSYSTSRGRRSGTRGFTVAWEDAFTFVRELRGGYLDFPAGDYTVPSRFPYVNNLYCSDATIVGLGVQGQASNDEGIYATYDKATVTAKYESDNPDFNPDSPETVEEESLSVSAEIATAEEGAWEWTFDSKPAPDSSLPAIVVSVTQFSVTRFHVSSLPDETIVGLAGKINNAAWRGYTTEYVLFMGAEARRSITTDGAEDWEVTYIFKVKPHSWNDVYRSEDTHEHYEAVQVKDGTDTLYQLGAFSGLGV